MSLGKPKAPPTPDYAAAAKAQGVANKDAALATGQISNPNVTNPYGTQTVTYTKDPLTGNPVPNVNQTFAPGQQQIFENEQALQQKLGFLGIGAADLAGQTINQPLDFNQRFGTQAQGRQEVIDAMMSRFDTDMGNRRENVNANLLARGIQPGNKAYETEIDRLERARTDALQQSIVGADQRAMDERRQAITEALAERQVPLNEISAFRTGSQIQPLQFSGVQGANVGAAPVFGAAQATGDAAQQNYANQVAARNAGLSGLFQLGSAGLIGAGQAGGFGNMLRW